MEYQTLRISMGVVADTIRKCHMSEAESQTAQVPNRKKRPSPWHDQIVQLKRPRFEPENCDVDSGYQHHSMDKDMTVCNPCTYQKCSNMETVQDHGNRIPEYIAIHSTRIHGNSRSKTRNTSEDKVVCRKVSPSDPQTVNENLRVACLRPKFGFNIAVGSRKRLF